MTCPCICPCQRAARRGGPCLPCLGGWHTGVCREFSPDTLNGRLRGIIRDETECGVCGSTRGEHRE